MAAFLPNDRTRNLATQNYANFGGDTETLMHRPLSSPTSPTNPGTLLTAGQPTLTSPARDAMMAGSNVNQARGTLPGMTAPAPTAGAAPAAPAAPTAPRTDLVTPSTVDMSGVNQAWEQQLAEFNKAFQNATNVGRRGWSNMMTRNAENAARMGLASGGASYLSGQRTANTAGYNAYQQQLQNWFDKFQAGSTAHAGQLLSGATSNAGFAQQADMFNKDWQHRIDERRTDAQTEMNANQNIGTAEQISKDFGYLFNENNAKSEAGSFDRLFTTYKNALSTGNPEEQKAAYEALMAFVTPIQQARERWIAEGQPGSFDDYYKSGGKTWKDYWSGAK